MQRLSLRASHGLAAPLSSPALAAWVASVVLVALVLLWPSPPVESGAALAFLAPMAEAGSAPNSRRCQECHRWEESLSHPTGISPNLKVPSHLPLEGGQVVCTTCHTATEHRGRGAGPMLRPAVSGSLCTDCHVSGRSRPEMHGSRLEKAHLSTRGGSAQSPTLDRLDRESEICMGCHDGTSATDVGSHAFNGAGTLGSGSEHPLGVRYQDNRSGGKDIHVVELNRLDRRIRLFGQSIGCGSCHSPYSKHRDLLVIENDRSRLCLSCHQQ